MSKIFWKSLLISPVVLGVALALSPVQKAGAAPVDGQQNTLNQIENYSSEGQTGTKDQITSVNDLRDVQPTDWAYEALRSLVERYGCIVGYPDRTYRGDKPLSRWEFAAGLNACMNTMERLIQEGGVNKEDIASLRKLSQEFQSELAALGAKVDNLEGRVSFLENHQFSTTTKLNGEVIFSLAGASSANNQLVFQDRVRLELDTSFTGEDKLVTRLAAGNYQAFNTSANINGRYFGGIQSPTTTTAAGVGNGNGNNSVAIDWLAYFAPIKFSKDFKLDTYVAAVGGSWYDFVPTLNPYFQDYDGGSGAISAFAQENPIYRIGGGAGAGVSLKVGFLESLLGPTAFSVGYLSGNGGGANGSSPANPGGVVGYAGTTSNIGANNPSPGSGLFDGSSAILAQINSNIGNVVNIGLTYVNGYVPEGQSIFGMGNSGFGSAVVGTPIANSSTGIPLIDNSRKIVNAYGIEAAFQLAKNISVSAFGTYGTVNFVGGTGLNGSGELWTYGGGIAFADLGKEGSVLGLFAGVQPYFGNETAINGSLAAQVGYSSENPVQIELFYKYPVTDNISITPGVIWISKPSQFAGSNSIVEGVLRGTFKF